VVTRGGGPGAALSDGVCVLQGTNSDLSQYKLSREELEEKRRARQHKPLEAYSGPPVVVRSCNQYLPSPCARARPPRFVQLGAGPARPRRRAVRAGRWRDADCHRHRICRCVAFVAV
jgi:hypothetical protein